MSLKILSQKSFAALFGTQFLGAFNDNLFKNVLVLMITYSSASFWGLEFQDLVALAGGLFILPFFLFSPMAGQISDKIDKARLIRATKLWEIFVMLIATLGFVLGDFRLLMVVLFFMGMQSAFFGPAKYSVLPEILKDSDLVTGNAYVELGTFLAILFGTLAGGVITTAEISPWWISSILCLVAGIGYLQSRGVRSAGPMAPEMKINWNPFTSMLPLIRIGMQKKAVWNSILGISWFWFFGATMLSLLPSYGKEFLQGDPSVATAFLVAFTVGIGIGSILCEKLSAGRVELGLVPIGSLGMTLFLIDLSLIVPSWAVASGELISLSQFLGSGEGVRILFDFFMLSIFGGVFIVPLYALIQQRSEESVRSQVIAANNVVNALFMVVAAVLLIVFNSLGFSIPEIFLITAVLNLLISIYIYTLVPEFTLRFLAWILTHMIYRLRSRGLEHIPKEGAAVLVCNHITFIDWLILSAACKRPARFVMYYKFAELPLARYLMRHAKVIPIAGKKENEEIYQQAFLDIEQALRDGDVVCLFPEGKLTGDGEIDEFRPGLLKIIEKVPVPVVPMALSGLWNSYFSRNREKKFPGALWRSIELRVSEPWSPRNVQMDLLQKQVSSLRQRP